MTCCSYARKYGDTLACGRTPEHGRPAAHGPLSVFEDGPGSRGGVAAGIL